ncbi:MAG TPA: MOSC N-terminal beta barrel domain-containing protein, partial [Ktedonobacteraceae bacterium]|nr:MOSC N-terminal beta barrel domain-containing protein [Ktedonobacteraceae bacterium]
MPIDNDMPFSNPVVSALNIYPIKSCGGIALQEASIGARGFYEDRAYMLIDALGYFITQREQPRMALIRPSFNEDGILTVKAPDMPKVTIIPTQTGKRHEVVIWNDTCIGVDQGNAAATWFSTFLDTECRLVRMPEDYTRAVDPRYSISQHDEVGFADGYPFLLISEASLDDLNARLKQPIPMNRFRPNIVVQNTLPYAEDTWRTIRIGSTVFHIVKSCARCEIPTTDQATANRGKEPLKTLSTYRHAIPGVMFGQNLIHEQEGSIQVGDPVEIIDVAAGPN